MPFVTKFLNTRCRAGAAGSYRLRPRVFAAVFSVFALLSDGCSGGYGSTGLLDKSGYAETRLNVGLYRVRYTGDEALFGQKLQDYALLRAAELCLEKGYKGFLIVSKLPEEGAEFASDESAVPLPTGNTGRGISFRARNPSYEIIVRFSNNPIPAYAVDAGKAVATLRQKYDL